MSHTIIVFVRYILLEWICRNENAERSYGELFCMFCGDSQHMELINTLQNLMVLFVIWILGNVTMKSSPCNSEIR